MSRFTLLAAIVPVLGLLTACPSEDDPVACTDIAMSSVSLTVTDADGTPIASPHGTFTVNRGDQQDCESWADGSLVCGYEQEGHFVVVVGADGYVDQVVEYDVAADECHVIGVTDTVVLEIEDEPVCTTEAVASVHVQIYEAGVLVDADAVDWRYHGDDILDRCDHHGVGDYTCAWEVDGELDIIATRGSEQLAARATVTADECHVVTVETSIDFEPEACTDVYVYGVSVTTTVSGAAADVDSVSWGLANADMAPQPCEAWGDGQYACAGEVSGLIEVYASRGDASRTTMVEVMQGECHVIPEAVTLAF